MLILFFLPLLFKGTRKGKTTCNLKFLHIFSHKPTLPSETWVLTPWWDVLLPSSI